MDRLGSAFDFRFNLSCRRSLPLETKEFRLIINIAWSSLEMSSFQSAVRVTKPSCFVNDPYSGSGACHRDLNVSANLAEMLEIIAVLTHKCDELLAIVTKDGNKMNNVANLNAVWINVIVMSNQ